MTLLDIGCGWGSTLKRAVGRHDVNVVGLTLSRNQHAASQRLLDRVDTDRSRRVLLRGWEEFDEPVRVPGARNPIVVRGLRFIKFMVTEIFPGARLPTSQKDHASRRASASTSRCRCDPTTSRH
jgi:cyclopropane fatty-acyl-phospholipid synthase-like methyltransferase